MNEIRSLTGSAKDAAINRLLAKARKLTASIDEATTDGYLVDGGGTLQVLAADVDQACRDVDDVLSGSVDDNGIADHLDSAFEDAVETGHDGGEIDW